MWELPNEGHRKYAIRRTDKGGSLWPGVSRKASQIRRRRDLESALPGRVEGLVKEVFPFTQKTPG